MGTTCVQAFSCYLSSSFFLSTEAPSLVLIDFDLFIEVRYDEKWGAWWLNGRSHMQRFGAFFPVLLACICKLIGCILRTMAHHSSHKTPWTASMLQPASSNYLFLCHRDLFACVYSYYEKYWYLESDTTPALLTARFICVCNIAEGIFRARIQFQFYKSPFSSVWRPVVNHEGRRRNAKITENSGKLQRINLCFVSRNSKQILLWFHLELLRSCCIPFKFIDKRIILFCGISAFLCLSLFPQCSPTRRFCQCEAPAF